MQSDEAILQAVSSNKNIFGCVDLPVLIQAIKNGIDVQYRPKADIKGEEFGSITPKKIGLQEVLYEFLQIE